MKRLMGRHSSDDRDGGVTEGTKAPGSERKDPNVDLGFGSVVSRESRKRLLNKDGSFNVRREGLSIWESVPLYHLMLTMSWPKFFAWLALGFFVTNALFAGLYVLLGKEALSGIETPTLAGRFVEEFFFSIHTISTIGYGNIVPRSFAANVVVAIESLVGLLALAIIAGIVFARFSRPTARIIFSRQALVAPYRDRTALMFRIANQRVSQLVDVRATVLFTMRRENGERKYGPLELERDQVVFFPLTWTVVHPIDEESPLHGLSREDLIRGDAEFLILITAFDETHSQDVHTRSSYKPEEVVFGARFLSVFNPVDDVVSVDIEKIHDYELIG